MEINRNAPATAEGELRIAADPQTVFAVISAIDQWPSWNPNVKSVALQGPVQPGTVFRWKRFHHPVVGDLELAFESFPLAADPSQSLLSYTAEPGSRSQDALRLLAS